jgi:hypothetical protein
VVLPLFYPNSNTFKAPIEFMDAPKIAKVYGEVRRYLESKALPEHVAVSLLLLEGVLEDIQMTQVQ